MTNIAGKKTPKVVANFVRGSHFLLTGFKLITQPKIRQFVLLPLAINISLISWLIYYSYSRFSAWLEAWIGWLPGWLGFVDWLLWPLFSVAMLAMVVLGFSFLANLIAAPFNGFLADAVQKHISGKKSPDSGRNIGLEIVHALGRELRKMSWYLPRILLLFILGWIPLINIAAPFLWMFFGAWMMAVQYLDYPMDNNQISFDKMFSSLRVKRSVALGLGGSVMLLHMIPLVNFLVMPAAIAGSVACWVDDFQEPENSL